MRIHIMDFFIRKTQQGNLNGTLYKGCIIQALNGTKIPVGGSYWFDSEAAARKNIFSIHQISNQRLRSYHTVNKDCVTPCSEEIPVITTHIQKRRTLR